MLPILYRPMVKEVLVLITSGVIATMICSRVYAAPLNDADQKAPVTQTASAPAPAPTQLAPVPQDQAREMLLAAIRGQTPLAPASVTGPVNGR